MKKFGFVFVACGLATACNSPVYDEQAVVAESYVHEYGVEVQPEVWSNQGQNGQVISTLQNGVRVTKNFNNGNLVGDVTYTFPHSDVVEKSETYNNDNLIKVVLHNTVGTPIKEITYQSPTNYTVKVWYDNGTPQSVEVYSNNLLMDGSYYTTKNQLEGKVVNGDGVKIERDSLGQLMANENVVHGQITQRKTFYSNGAPREIIPIVNGQPDGVKKSFTMTGEPDQHQEVKNGQQEGITTVFRNGEKYAEIPYANGQLNGVEKRYKGNKLVEEITWVDGQRHGPSSLYAGNTVKTDWYFKGQIMTEQQFKRMSIPSRN
jgi:antitoxin component YwqK of YwqJK toxin-antitoxin module